MFLPALSNEREKKASPSMLHPSPDAKCDRAERGFRAGEGHSPNTPNPRAETTQAARMQLKTQVLPKANPQASCH